MNFEKTNNSARPDIALIRGHMWRLQACNGSLALSFLY